MSVKTIYLPELKPLTQSSDAPATANSRSQQRTDQRVLELTYIEIFSPKKLVSNLCKNFLCIAWHQKPKV